MSDESEEVTDDLLKREDILETWCDSMSKDTSDEPSYYLNHRAYCMLEARLFAKRIGLHFPQPDRLGYPNGVDKSIRGLIMYVVTSGSDA